MVHAYKDMTELQPDNKTKGINNLNKSDMDIFRRDVNFIDANGKFVEVILGIDPCLKTKFVDRETLMEYESNMKPFCISPSNWVPANKAQKALFNLMVDYFMYALGRGTQKQLDAIKMAGIYDIDEAISHLKKIGLLYDGEARYASSTMKFLKKLPDAIEELTDLICKEVMEEEYKRIKAEGFSPCKEDICAIKDNKDETMEFVKKFQRGVLLPTHQTIESMALFNHLGDVGYMDFIKGVESQDDSRYKYDDRTFIVGNDYMLEELASSYMDEIGYEDLWRQSVSSRSTYAGYEDWKSEIIRIDGVDSVFPTKKHSYVKIDGEYVNVIEFEE